MASATYQVVPPQPFDFSSPNEWIRWIRRFERFRAASGLEEKGEETQVNTLIYIMTYFTPLIYQMKTRKSTKPSRINSTHTLSREKILSMSVPCLIGANRKKVSVDTFITALYTLSEHCNYGALKEEMIRDRIVVGLRDSNLSLKLQLDEKLDLQKAITQVREAETIKQQQPTLRGAQKETTANVSNLHKRSNKKEQGPQHRRAPKQPVNKRVCARCGKSPPHDRQYCPAKDATCRECRKRGHYKLMCRSKNKIGEVYHDSASNDYECDDYEYDDIFLGSVETEHDNPWLISLQLEGKPVEFHIDTGAEVSVITEPVHKKIGRPPLSPVKQTLRGPSNAVLPVKGLFSAILSRDSQQSKQDILWQQSYINPSLDDPP